ncbi:MAG: hypothetical protein IE887_02885 [Campylobacterales bacterium]|nr:hypothetical protein [Campylobacterales bacterium]
MLIITSFLLSVSGCGYKAAPYYEKDTPASDENVEFHIKEKKFDTNESCN